MPVHRKKESDNYYPSGLISDIRQHFILRSHNFVISSLLTTLHSFATSSYIHCSLCHACSITSRCTQPLTVSYRILYRILFIFHSLDSYFLLQVVEERVNQSSLNHSYCRFISLQAYQWRVRHQEQTRGPARVGVAGAGVAAAAAAIPTPTPSPHQIFFLYILKIFLILFHGPAIKFERYPCDTAEIVVWYVPVPVMGTVQEICTCGIPVTNTSCAKSCSFNQTFVTVRAQSWHPKKSGHMSFHIKYSAVHAKARHMFNYSTEG